MPRAQNPRAQTVLVVEDSYLLLEILASLCEAQGIAVLEASTGEAALTLLRTRGPEIDGLLTDIRLPGLIDGLTVARAYRALHPDRPVVYTSTDIAGARVVPGSLFLRKPFQLREVEAIVRLMTDGPATAPLRAAG